MTGKPLVAPEAVGHHIGAKVSAHTWKSGSVALSGGGRKPTSKGVTIAVNISASAVTPSQNGKSVGGSSRSKKRPSQCRSHRSSCCFSSSLIVSRRCLRRKRRSSAMTTPVGSMMYHGIHWPFRKPTLASSFLDLMTSSRLRRPPTAPEDLDRCSGTGDVCANVEPLPAVIDTTGIQGTGTVRHSTPCTEMDRVCVCVQLFAGRPPPRTSSG